ncbi:hypothetical protein ACFVKB_17290 [Rhodococcus sp. NPDC127530]|uniref:hypothetical protein n=1 Tax=unclassified Rhodococcus (in: high G+C Gram-positive bacteria) TaxID=192944 RepID=UPI0036433D12
MPIVNGREWMSWLRTPEQGEALQDALDEDRRRRFTGQPSARVPVAGLFSSNEVCGVPTDAEVRGFMASLDELSRTWCQDIALESVDRVLAFNPSATIDQIAPRPLLVIALSGYEVLHPLQLDPNGLRSRR